MPDRAPDLPPASLHASATRLTERQKQRRQRILHAAQDLTGQRGYDGTSMRAIAAASHVTEKTLYNIFGSKDRLIATAAQHRSAEVFEAAAHALSAGGVAYLLEFARRVADVTLEAPEMARVLAQVLLDYSELVGLQDVYAIHVGNAFDRMREDGIVADGASRESFIRLMRLGIVSTVLFWAHNEVADEELAAHLELQVCRCLLSILRARSMNPILRRIGAISQTL